MLTKQQAELLAEYERCTRRTVTLDYQRLIALAQLANRDVTREDIFTIVAYIRRRIRLGDNKRKVGTFTPASLEFGNLLGDAARFEDRLQTAREEALAKAKRGRGPKAKVLECGNGETITRLEEAPSREAEPIRNAIATYLKAVVKALEVP